MNERAKKWTAMVAALVGLMVVGSTVRRGCTRTDRMAMADAGVDQALTARLASEVSLASEPGKILLVRFTGLIPSMEKVQKAQVRGFERGLKGSGWEVVELPPPDLSEEAHGNWVLRCSSGDWGADLLKWAGPHADAVAIVSLVGAPRLPPDRWKSLPPLYAKVTDADPYLRSLVEQGEVAGLALMRLDADPVAIRTFRGPLDDLFEMAYEYLDSTGER